MQQIIPCFSPKKSCHFSIQLFIRSCFLIFILGSCHSKKFTSEFNKYRDTTVLVYGPYIAVKLPITNGVRIANPIQVKLGPEGVLYASNQTGEIYSLRDTDKDGLEDMALLYCNVKDFGLRSPAGITHRGDTMYIGTAQQIRAFFDKDKDGKADTSWVFFDEISNSEHPYEWSSTIRSNNCQIVNCFMLNIRKKTGHNSYKW